MQRLLKGLVLLGHKANRANRLEMVSFGRFSLMFSSEITKIEIFRFDLILNFKKLKKLNRIDIIKI